MSTKFYEWRVNRLTGTNHIFDSTASRYLPICGAFVSSSYPVIVRTKNKCKRCEKIQELRNIEVQS